MTTTRFIRLEPAPSSPRSPAVPNSSVPSNRSARSAASPASITLLELGAGLGVGVVGGPGPGLLDQVGHASQASGHDRGVTDLPTARRPRPAGRDADPRARRARRACPVRRGVRRPAGGRGPGGVRAGAALPDRAPLGRMTTRCSTRRSGRTTGSAPGALGGSCTAGTTLPPPPSCSGWPTSTTARPRCVSRWPLGTTWRARGRVLPRSRPTSSRGCGGTRCGPSGSSATPSTSTTVLAALDDPDDGVRRQAARAYEQMARRLDLVRE